MQYDDDTGWSKETVDCNISLTEAKPIESALTQLFLESLYWEILVFQCLICLRCKLLFHFRELPLGPFGPNWALGRHNHSVYITPPKKKQFFIRSLWKNPKRNMNWPINYEWGWFGEVYFHHRCISTIIIIITRPWPAFGRQGLVGSSGGYTSHGYTSHASPRACGARLGQMGET